MVIDESTHQSLQLLPRFCSNALHDWQTLWSYFLMWTEQRRVINRSPALQILPSQSLAMQNPGAGHEWRFKILDVLHNESHFKSLNHSYKTG